MSQPSAVRRSPLTVSCIIPFWNESERIESVLKALKAVSLIDEILLVDDGSTDGGIETNDTRIQLFRFEENQGKSAAMKYGFWKSKGEIILFLDADLKGITDKEINRLLMPILNKECDITLGLREYFHFFDVVGGERALLKEDWLTFFEKENFHKNAIEIGMNRYILLRNLKVKTIPWENVRQVYKTDKIGFFKGMKKDISYVVDWMEQLGIFSFSCTYLLFWFLIARKKGKLIDWFKTLYKKMFSKEFSYLLTVRR